MADERQAVTWLALVPGFGTDRLDAEAQVSQRLTQVREQSGTVGVGEILRPRAMNHSVAGNRDQEILEILGRIVYLCCQLGRRMVGLSGVRRHYREFLF